MTERTDVGDAVEAALAALEAGDPARAHALAEQGLARHPDAEPLWRLAGLCARLTGDAVEAERCWRRCIDIAPSAAMCLRLGDLLIEQARPGDAALCWRAAVWLDEHVTPAVEERLAAARTGLRGDDADVEALYAAAAASADGPRTAIQFGVLLAAAGRLPEAERAHRLALALLPGDAAALTDLGLVLEAQGRLDEAETLQRRALAAAPGSIEILGHLADVLAARGDDAEAERLYRAAIASHARADIAHSNLGVLLFDAGRLAEAEAAFRAALAIRPDSTAATMNLGQLLLADGRLAPGWALCDVSYARDAAKVLPGFPLDTGACRRWQGESLQGRSLLVWADQGLGDQLQFCRYLALLPALQPATMTLVCAATLRPLFERSLPADAVHALGAESGELLRHHDHWVPLLGLPLRFGTDERSIPAPRSYLETDPARCAAWAARLPTAGPGERRIGLVWRGNPLHDNDRDRSLPGLAALAPLWSVPGLHLVSLQKGACEDEAAAPPPGQPLTALGADCRDMDDTAAIVAQLDLVISVDSAVAHLAGAFGVPCWILLPARRCDWRWQLGRADTPWYPAARLFRQPRRGDWATPVAEIVDALRRGPDPAVLGPQPPSPPSPP